MSVRAWAPALKRLAAPSFSRRPARLGRDWALEDRLAPAGDVGTIGAAFDAAGRGLPGNQSRISDGLLRVFNAYHDAGAGWAAADSNDALAVQVDAAGRVLVRVTASDVTALEPALAGIGFAEVSAAPDYHLTEGWLPLTALPAAEALDGQGLMGLLPVLRPQLSVGLTTSQGDWVLEADRVKGALPAAYDGTGIKVGVLSDSYATATSPITTAAQDIANGDLPAAGVSVLAEGPAGQTDEGRGMLQIVHDVAPGASESFASAFLSEASFGSNIQALATAGAKVIVDDVFYYDEPYYQYGLVGQAVANVVNNNGVTYFSSAGNQATQAWEQLNPAPAATIVNGTAGTWFNFNPAGTADYTQRVTISNGGSGLIGLEWDQPYYTVSGVTSNVDVFLYRADTGALVASSTDNNLASQTPFEFIGYGNNTGQTAFDVAIRLTAGPTPGRLKYKYYNNMSVSEYATNSPTISSHAGVPEAAGVAAVPYYNQRLPESFTSAGPMTILFDRNGNRLSTPIISPNPLITAPDGVNTSFFGSDADFDGRPNFFGTSAAAPHAAAVAALVRQAYPALFPVQVYQKLVDSADSNTGNPGFDSTTGWGLIDAYRAIFGTTPANAGGSVQDTFDSGSVGSQWETYSTGPGRTQVTTANGPVAGAHVILQEGYGDAPGVNGIFGRNELTLHVNPLAAGSTGILRFFEKEFNDDDNPMPATFTGSGNYDGVAFSPDGNTWYRLVSLTGSTSTNSYQSFQFDLRAAAAAAGVTLTGDTRIRFQQYDDENLPNDGIAFDNFSFGVNQVPSFTKGPDQTVLEDAGAQSVPTWATGISPGLLENAQSVSFEVTSNSNPDLFNVPPTIDSSGRLTYTPAADANGFADIVVRIKDNGGTAGGGIDTSVTQTFRITVTPVNNVPSFTKGADQTVLEDAGAQTVPNWAMAISAGPPDESGQTLAFQVVTNSNPGLFAVAPAVSSSGTLIFTAAANANGSATIQVQLQDSGGGTDTSPTQSFTINVMSVNDVPTFTAGGNQIVNEDAGPRSLPGWATGISSGPANELGQVLTFDVATNNDALFATMPTVGSTGTLSFMSTPNASGTASITVRLRDNGGTANGGVDTSSPQTFTITVNPVNDAPSFTPGVSVSVLEDAGPFAVAEWATNLSVGPVDEASQTLSFEIVSNSNPGLFAAGPTVSPVGTLRFTSAPDANGSATIQVRTRDSGGTNNGGVDVSPTQTFTITVAPVNDAPVAQPDAATVGTTGPTLFDVRSNDTDADGDLLTILSFTQPVGGTVVQVGQQLQYTPKAHTRGADPFTYTITDGHGETSTTTVTPTVVQLNPPSVTQMRIGYGTGRSIALPDRIPVFGWSTITAVSVMFNEDVSVDLGDLTVTGRAGLLSIAGFHYDPATWTATWILAQPIGIDRVTIRLDGTSPAGVRGQGNSLPLVGGDFVRSFGVLPGDLDGNGIVTLAEANKVKKLIGKRYPALAGADVDGDGVVTKKDYAIIKANVGKRL
jgi:Bacterial Ig domain/Subtilase family